MNNEHKPESKHSMPDLRLGEESDGLDYTVGLLRTLRISLHENPSTGYLWIPKEFNDYLLEILKESFTPESEDESEIGVGGTKHYLLRAIQQGQTLLTFTQQRPWEANSDSLKVFQVSLTIE